MRRILATGLSCAVLMLGARASAVEGPQPAAKAKTLYQRLGGFDRLAAFVDDVGPRMAADPQLKRFFEGRANDSHQRNRMRLLELLCQETGGPCTYTGRPLKTAHTGVGVTAADWTAFQKHMNASLDHLQFAVAEKADLLAIIERYKPDVVEKP